MKSSGGRILLKYFGTVIILFSLFSYSSYAILRRNRRSYRAITTCITTTAAIATSVNKLAILFTGPVMTDVQMKIGGMQ